MMVSPWAVEEVASELSDAGAPFTSAFLMALVNEVFSAPPHPHPVEHYPLMGFFDLL